ncbi:MAG: hypothetical protein Q8T09_02905 [Candidatus Melainabacteria bacterium]|jgi:hypothetical protein|nr:hypothetical protein [Candidatus Melainabacteria bacterium]
MAKLKTKTSKGNLSLPYLIGRLQSDVSYFAQLIEASANAEHGQKMHAVTTETLELAQKFLIAAQQAAHIGKKKIKKAKTFALKGLELFPPLKSQTN